MLTSKEKSPKTVRKQFKTDVKNALQQGSQMEITY